MTIPSPPLDIQLGNSHFQKHIYRSHPSRVPDRRRHAVRFNNNDDDDDDDDDDDGVVKRVKDDEIKSGDGDLDIDSKV